MLFTNLLHTDHHSVGLGRLIHELLESFGFSEAMTEFISHLLVDCAEVMGLLLLVMTAVFFLQSYVNFNKLKEKLANLRSIWGYGLAGFLGMLSPFCSCSIIPVLIGLLSMGVPLSVCLCMLTSASLLNLTALLGISGMLGSFFWWYVGGSLLLIVGSSLVMSRVSFDPSQLRISREGEEHHHHHDGDCCCEDGGCQDVCGHSDSMTIPGRLRLSFGNAWKVLKSAWLYILLGVTLSAALMSFFPMEKIIRFVNENSFLSVTLAGLIGFPIHSDLFSALPVLSLLLDISPVAALTFALSTMAISIPGIVLLSRVLRPKTIALYAGTLLLLALGLGWLLILI